MKSLKLMVLAIGLIGIFGVGNVMAADEATLEVTADVLAACSFESDAMVDFGTIDPLNPTALSASTSDITIVCTNQTVYTIEDDGVRAMTNGTDSINYTLTYVDTAQTATGAVTPIPVQIDIAADYNGVSAGDYTGTTTFNVLF